MTEDFEPDQYHDAYREALEAVVQAKIEGNDVVRPSGVDLPDAKKQPADLTEILRASVAAAKGGRDQADGDGTPRKAKPRRTASACPNPPRTGRAAWSASATTRSSCAAPQPAATPSPRSACTAWRARAATGPT